MKKITLLMIMTLLIISCSKSKEETMLYDYEKSAYLKTLSTNIDNVDFKIKSFEKVKDVTAKDSIDILQKYFNEKQNKKISQFNELIKNDKESLIRAEESLKNAVYENYNTRIS